MTVPWSIQTLRHQLTRELPTALALAFNSVMAPALGQVSPISQTAVVYTTGAVTTGVLVNHSLICEPWRLTRVTVGKTCGEARFRSARFAAQAGETGDVNDGFHEAEIHTRDNQPDWQNRSDRFTFVIHYLSQSPSSAANKFHKHLLSSGLWRGSQIVAKGNIHPFAGANVLAREEIKVRKRTAMTVKTGQTIQFVIRISSARMSGCYQTKAALPVINEK